MKKNLMKILLAVLMTSLILTSCSDGDGEGTTMSTTPDTVEHINVGGNTGDTKETTGEPEATETQASTDETSGEASDTLPEGVELGTFTEDDCTVTIAGVTLSIGMDFLPHINAFGEPRIEEGQACLDGGYDTNYYYGDSLSVYTYAKDGKQVIYDIYITGAEYKTGKGATVGVTTKDTIAALYGEPTDSFMTTMVYSLPGSDVEVSFTFSGDVLESIDILDGGVS